MRAEAAAAAAGETSYGIGLLAWLAKDRPDLVDVVIELRPPFVALSYGDYGPLIAQVACGRHHRCHPDRHRR